ncbi:PIN domain-containing protein [Candidatus Woesearchaeota archaeon]|nr:PIN domain-containing protein [Candidatus Woesearchaeota archaeon]
MTDSKVLLDTSAWLAFFDAKDDKQIFTLMLGNTIIYTSVLTLFEMRRKFLKGGIEEDAALKFLEAVREHSILAEITDTIALSGAEYAAKKRLASVDSLIYATAMQHACTLITFDNDFRGLQNVKVLKLEDKK